MALTVRMGGGRLGICQRKLPSGQAFDQFFRDARALHVGGGGGGEGRGVEIDSHFKKINNK